MTPSRWILRSLLAALCLAPPAGPPGEQLADVGKLENREGDADLAELLEEVAEGIG